LLGHLIFFTVALILSAGELEHGLIQFELQVTVKTATAKTRFTPGPFKSTPTPIMMTLIEATAHGDSETKRRRCEGV
jgi:hypothetical protein